MMDQDASPSEELFTSIAVRLLGEPDVDEGRLFSAHGLRTNGKIFIMLTRGDRITAKLPEARRNELVRDGRGEHFEAGGRQMREWVSLIEPSADDAQAIADEALVYLRALHGPAGGSTA